MIEIVLPSSKSFSKRQMQQSFVLFPFILNLIIIRYTQQFIPIYNRLTTISLDYVKPIDNKRIVKDFFIYLSKVSLVTILLDSIIITVMVFWRLKNVPYLSYPSVMCLTFSLLIFAKSISIYFVNYRFRTFLYAMVFLIEFITVVTFFNTSDLSSIKPLTFGLISLLLLILSAIICYFAYHRWQKMEWGAK